MHLRTTHVASIVVGVAVIAGASLTLLQDRQTISADKPVGNARLIIANQAARVGDTFDLPIKLVLPADSGGASGADLVITYNPTILAIVDMDSEASGIQVAAGNVFDFVQENRANISAGVINLSMGQQPTNQPVSSVDGFVASVRFKAIAAGQAGVQFAFTPGLLNDTNVIKSSDGRDLLSAVQGAVITVSP